MDLKFELCQFKLSRITDKLAKFRSSSTTAQVCFYDTTL